MRLALGCKSWTLALVTAVAVGCGGNPPKKQATGGSGGDETGGTGGSTGGSPGTGGGKAGSGGSGGTGGSTGGTGGSTGGTGGRMDAGADAADDAAVPEDAAADLAPPDVAPDLPPPMYEAPRAPWLGRDIGPAGTQVGGVVLNTQVNGGQSYDLISSGASGIGGTADGFFFMYQPMIGPGVVQGRLVSLGMGGVTSAGGLMIRATLDPDSAMVFIGATGDGTVGGQVIVRRAQGQAAEAVPMNATLPLLKAANANMLRLVRTGNTVRVYAGAPNIIETDAALVGGGMVELTLPGGANTPLLYGAAVTSGSATAPTSARFNELAINNLASRPVTDTFTYWAIGTSGQSAVWMANNRLVLTGNGQPWGAVMGTSRDFMGLAYQRNNDNASLRVLVESQTISDPRSRVALVVRDVSGNGLPRSAATVALSLTQGVGLELERRAASTDNDELMKVATRGATTAPLWLRLDKSVIPRAGDPLGTTDTYVTAYWTTAANNGNPQLPWNLLGNSFVFPATNSNPPGLGIAVASFTGVLHQATLSQVQVVAAPPPPDGGVLIPDASPDAEADAGVPDAATDAAADASADGG
jgi:hypothetical protein